VGVGQAERGCGAKLRRGVGAEHARQRGTCLRFPGARVAHQIGERGAPHLELGVSHVAERCAQGAGQRSETEHQLASSGAAGGSPGAHTSVGRSSGTGAAEYGTMHTRCERSASKTTALHGLSESPRSSQTYPLRQSLSDPQGAMQKLRVKRENSWPPAHPGSGESCVPKATHTESSGHVPGSQSKMVQ